MRDAYYLLPTRNALNIIDRKNVPLSRLYRFIGGFCSFLFAFSLPFLAMSSVCFFPFQRLRFRFISCKSAPIFLNLLFEIRSLFVFLFKGRRENTLITIVVSDKKSSPEITHSYAYASKNLVVFRIAALTTQILNLCIAYYKMRHTMLRYEFYSTLKFCRNDREKSA